MQLEGLTGQALDAVCIAVAAETGVPAGRVRKVLLAAQRLGQAGGQAPAVEGSTAPPHPLRFYPLGANGRIQPQPQADHAADRAGD
jgi:hypothetical protein